MKILFVGEIVAKPGREIVSNLLPQIKKENNIDLVIANAENLSGGRGITPEKIKEMQDCGVDYFTGGDHIYQAKDTYGFIDELPVVRPANYPDDAPGKPYAIIDTGSKGKVLLFNLIGRTSFSNNFAYLQDPFRKADEILNKIKDDDVVVSILDFHAEASSEKAALAFYLDGRLTGFVGSHTHVPTADNRVLPKGTMFVSDVGMCGAIDSSLGVKVDIVIDKFLTGMPKKFAWESAGTKAFRSVLLDTEANLVARIDKIII